MTKEHVKELILILRSTLGLMYITPVFNQMSVTRLLERLAMLELDIEKEDP